MFYFNLDDGQIDLDQRGINFPDIPAARAEAVSTLADRLHDSNVGTPPDRQTVAAVGH